MRHGFKTRAERISATARTDLSLALTDALDAPAYAARLGIVILDFEALSLSEKARRQLLVVDDESWSGMTIKHRGVTAVVLNPRHVPERRNSTLTHEVSHVVLGHAPTRVDVSDAGILLVSEYSKDDEDEADWLAGALLLPRQALIEHRQQGLSVEQIARRHAVSRQMCEWRVRMTGVDLQLRRAKASG